MLSQVEISQHDHAAASSVRGISARLSPGHALMLLVALLAGLLNYGLLRADDEQVPVTVAASDLVAGHVIAASDLTTTTIPSDDSLLATLLSGDRRSTAVGAVTTGPLRAGDPLRISDLRAPTGDGLRAMSLPVDPAHAAGGSLQAGDLVDVVTVRDEQARYALTHVEVLDVEHGSGPGLAAADALVLTLAVDDDDALRLADAMTAEHLEVVRATGASPARPSVGEEPQT